MAIPALPMLFLDHQSYASVKDDKSNENDEKKEDDQVQCWWTFVLEEIDKSSLWWPPIILDLLPTNFLLLPLLESPNFLKGSSVQKNVIWSKCWAKKDEYCCLLGILGPHYANGATSVETTIENIYIFTCDPPLKMLKNNSGKSKDDDDDENVDIWRELLSNRWQLGSGHPFALTAATTTAIFLSVHYDDDDDNNNDDVDGNDDDDIPVLVILHHVTVTLWLLCIKLKWQQLKTQLPFGGYWHPEVGYTI